MRRYKYVGPADEGVELRHDGHSFTANKDGIFEVPFDLDDRADFEEIKPKEKIK